MLQRGQAGLAATVAGATVGTAAPVQIHPYTASAPEDAQEGGTAMPQF